MSAWSKTHAGPLDAADTDALVALLRSWQRGPAVALDERPLAGDSAARALAAERRPFAPPPRVWSNTIGVPLDVTLDPSRLPTASRYLASLPNGLDSYPGCRVRDITVEPYASAFSALASEPGLPPPVADLLSGIPGGTWYPEVVFQTAHLVVRDRVFAEEPAFFEWIFNANALLFDRPIVRNLMRLVSPTLVVLGATKRWANFHTGSELTAERAVVAGERAQTFAHLKYPTGLFSTVFLHGLEHVFMAALLASRAREPGVKLARVENAGAGVPGAGSPDANVVIASYEVSWRA